LPVNQPETNPLFLKSGPYQKLLPKIIFSCGRFRYDGSGRCVAARRNHCNFARTCFRTFFIFRRRNLGGRLS
jgi:hypothetical protein